MFIGSYRLSFSKIMITMNSEFLVIAGPCVIEDEAMALTTARTLRSIADDLGITLVYKSSFDKANRGAFDSPRGPGLEKGLAILAKVKHETGLAVLTDVHETDQVNAVAEVADILQIPAFLSRQTDLICAAVKTGRQVNIKKGQFMAPDDMVQVVGKAAGALDGDMALAQKQVILCERGTSFGYHNLVVDMAGFAIMRATGCRVIFDASHAVQRPSALGTVSGGNRSAIPALARAAAAVGIDGLFIETHPSPNDAHSDAATVWPLDQLKPLLADVLAIHRLVQAQNLEQV
jgi:2-dehydro-3-deoxyphosphooctonate aldolase (KDO 8-P synthase)